MNCLRSGKSSRSFRSAERITVKPTGVGSSMRTLAPETWIAPSAPPDLRGGSCVKWTFPSQPEERASPASPVAKACRPEYPEAAIRSARSIDVRPSCHLAKRNTLLYKRTVIPEEGRVANADKEKAIELAVSAIEKQFGKGSVMRLGVDEPLVQDIAAISTGSVSLDLALGVGGIPRGRVIEIYGPEASGKTTLTLHVIAE